MTKSFQLIFVICFIISINALNLRASDVDVVEKFQGLTDRLKDLAKMAKDELQMTPNLVTPILFFEDLIKEKAYCAECKATIQAMHNLVINNATGKAIFEAAYLGCRTAQTKQVCDGIFYDTYGPVFEQNIGDRLIRPEIACGRMRLCDRNYTEDREKEYIERVIADKPNKTAPNPTKRATYKFVHLTDMHFDWKYKEGNDADCDQPLCCREDSGAPKNSSGAAQYWGTKSKCDVPARTIDQLLEFIAKNIDYDFIIWTGDNNSHDVWEQQEATQLNQTLHTTNKIKEYMPNATVFPMFGNHECFPCDQCNVVDNQTQWMTQPLSDAWQTWLSAEAYAEFRANGYYAEYNQDKNLKMIALNTQACDFFNFYLLQDPEDPQEMLKWLEDELKDSENNEQGVFIIGHIPSGDSFCDSNWASRFSALVDRYSATIRGIFYGHTHKDQIEVYHSYKEKTPIAASFIAPSITTFSYLQPSFRVFEVDSDTNVVINYDQYRLDLDKWNQNTTGPIEWDLAYDFLSEYQLDNLNPESIEDLAQRMIGDKKVMETYVSNFYTGNPPAGDITEKEGKHYYCEAQNGIYRDALTCLGKDADATDVLTYLLQILPGDWIHHRLADYFFGDRRH